jgi:hypothetical protein
MQPYYRAARIIPFFKKEKLAAGLALWPNPIGEGERNPGFLEMKKLIVISICFGRN